MLCNSRSEMEQSCPRVTFKKALTKSHATRRADALLLFKQSSKCPQSQHSIGVLTSAAKMNPDEYIDAAVGWMLDTMGPWSPALLLLSVAGVLLTMAVRMRPASKSRAEIEEENARLLAAGFDENGNLLPEGDDRARLAELMARGGDMDDDEGGYDQGWIMDEEADSDDEVDTEATKADIMAMLAAVRAEEEAEAAGEGEEETPAAGTTKRRRGKGRK